MGCNCGGKKIEEKQQALIEKFEARTLKAQTEEQRLAMEKHLKYLQDQKNIDSKSSI